MHCSDGTCHGARATWDVDDYYYYPYYYYPYYYAYYACPSYGSSMVYGSYGTPVYSCSQTVIVSSKVSVPSSGSGSKGSTKAQAKSAPVVMYDIEPGVAVYSTSYDPEDVYSKKKDGRHYWVPGAKKGSKQVKGWIKGAIESNEPTANATVITYELGAELVYLTNEAPMPGIHTRRSGDLHAWIAGVSQPSEEERDALAAALTAHSGGGSAALEREVRKLQESREPPPKPEKQG